MKRTSFFAFLFIQCFVIEILAQSGQEDWSSLRLEFYLDARTYRFDFIKNDTSVTLNCSKIIDPQEPGTKQPLYYTEELKESLLIYPEYLKTFSQLLFIQSIESIEIHLDTFELIKSKILNNSSSEIKVDFLQDNYRYSSLFYRYQSDTSTKSGAFEGFRRPTNQTQVDNIISLIQFFESNLESIESSYIIDQLRLYYMDTLPIRQISKHPLEYRIYGRILNQMSDDFEQFLTTLTTSKKIIIDTRNCFFSDWNPTLKSLVSYANKNPNSAFLVNKYNKRNFKKAGINKRQLFSERNNLLNE